MKNINREGKLLQELMNQRGESNSDLARALDVSPSTVTLWLKGVRSPFATQTMLLKIASHYNVSPNYLLGVAENATNDDELNEILLEMKNRPELRMLFKTTMGTTKEDIERTAAIVAALKKRSEKNNE